MIHEGWCAAIGGGLCTCDSRPTAGSREQQPCTCIAPCAHDNLVVRKEVQTKSGAIAVIFGAMPNGCRAGYVKQCSLPTGWTEEGKNISGMTDYDLTEDEPIRHIDLSEAETTQADPLPTPQAAKTARKFAETWLGERFVTKYSGQIVSEVSVQMAVDLADAYTASLQQENAALREQLDEARKIQLRHDKGESWFWQGEGCDFPDSLTCPVIIQPETLRKLLAAEREAEYEKERFKKRGGELDEMEAEIAALREQYKAAYQTHLENYDWAKREQQRAEAAESEVQRVREALEKVEFIASNAGHAPCRSGGINEEGVCPNVCHCEWASDILAALAGKE